MLTKQGLSLPMTHIPNCVTGVVVSVRNNYSIGPHRWMQRDVFEQDFCRETEYIFHFIKLIVTKLFNLTKNAKFYHITQLSNLLTISA